MSTNGAYAGLRMAARAASPDPESNPQHQPSEEESDAGCSRKDNETMTDTTTNDEAIAQARAEATAAANARFGKVLASEHYAGNEKLAATLLANDKMSADEVIAALAAVEKPEAAAADPEAAARDEMKAALAEASNSGIDATAGSPPSMAQETSASWDRIYDRAFGKQAN